MPNSALGGQAAISFLPAGAMVDFAGTTAPSGWLMCDGAAVSRTTYASLFAALGTAYGSGDGSTTFNLPDYRGRFARYFDNMGTVAGAANRDTSSRNADKSQADAMQGHRHIVALNYNANPSSTGTEWRVRSITNGALATDTVTSVDPSTDGTNGTPRTSTETRPINLASYRIIKY